MSTKKQKNGNYVHVDVYETDKYYHIEKFSDIKESQKNMENKLDSVIEKVHGIELKMSNFSSEISDKIAEELTGKLVKKALTNKWVIGIIMGMFGIGLTSLSLK